MTRTTMKKVGYTGALLTAAVGVAAGTWRLLSSLTDHADSRHSSWDLDESDLKELDSEPQASGPIVNHDTLQSLDQPADITILPMNSNLETNSELMSKMETPGHTQGSSYERTPGVPPEDNEDYHRDGSDETDYLSAQSFPASDPPGHY